ncbi:MAG: hypothetical protein WA880_01025, partial [Ornithinimicrobium sp.]
MISQVPEGTLDDALPGWVSFLGLSLTIALTIAFTIPMALVLINRTVLTLTLALHDLAQRADDFGAGSFGQDRADGTPDA